MKRYLIIFTLFLFAGIVPAKADYIATQTFEIDVDTTMTVVISGNQNTAINGLTGTLGSPLDINFNISTNQDISGIKVKTFVQNASLTKSCACVCNTPGLAVETSIPFQIMLGNDTHMPTVGAVDNCEDEAPTSMLNGNVIAYPATISINNGGTLQFQDLGDESFFSTEVKTGTTDINLALSGSPCTGTYDVVTGQDEADNYVLEVFLDNIPS